MALQDLLAQLFGIGQAQAADGTVTVPNPLVQGPPAPAVPTPPSGLTAENAGGFLGLPGALLQRALIGKEVGGPETPNFGLLGAIGRGAGTVANGVENAFDRTVLSPLVSTPAIPNAPATMLPQGPAAQSFKFPEALTSATAARNQNMTIPGPSPKSYVDFVTGLESNGDPNAQNKRSSAGGAGQFIDSTWVATLKEARPDLVKNLSKEEILKLKFDPELSRQMTDFYGDKNAQFLEAHGLPSDNASKYVAHLLGPGGAAAAMKAPPGTPIKDIIGEDAYNANTNPKTGKFVYGETTDQVLRTIQQRAATQGAGMPGAPVLRSAQLPGAPVLPVPQIPGVTPTVAPQLPGAPQMQAPVPTNLDAARKAIEGARPVDRATDPRENVQRLLMGLASGAAGGKGWGDVIAGAAGSGNKAATGFVDAERARHDLYSTSTLPGYMMKLADFEVGAAKMASGDKNAVIQVGNENLLNRDKRTVEQEKLNVDAKNTTSQRSDVRALEQVRMQSETERANALSADQRMMEQVKLDANTTNQNVLAQNEAEKERWKMSLPKVHVTENGLSIQRTDPNTGATTLQTQTFNDFDRQMKQAKLVHEALGKDSPEAEKIRYTMAGRLGGTEGLKREVMKDAVDRNALKEILGADNYKKLEKEIKSSIPAEVAAPGNPKYKSEFDARALDLMQKWAATGKLKDADWIPKMAQLQNIGARLLVAGGKE